MALIVLALTLTFAERGSQGIITRVYRQETFSGIFTSSRQIITGSGPKPLKTATKPKLTRVSLMPRAIVFAIIEFALYYWQNLRVLRF